MKTPIMAIMMVALAISLSASVLAYNPNARVKAIHASPDAPAVDILVNGEKAFTDIEFKESTDIARLPALETYNFQVVPTGATDPVVINADLMLHPFRSYTILAVDNLAEITPVVIEDKPLNVGRKTAAVRFVHASPDAPAVDIAVKDGPVLFSNVEFKEYSDYLKVRGGTYDLEVRLAGTDTVVLSLPGIELMSEYEYTAVAVGEVSEGTLNAALFSDGKARLMFR
jgi:hypothetical protein